MQTDGTTSSATSGFARRDLLRMGLAGGGALAATPLLARLTGPAGGTALQSASSSSSGGVPDPPGFRHFSQELVVPKVLEAPVVDGRKTYSVTQYAKLLEVLPRPFPMTERWTFNGTFPGPTIRQVRDGPFTTVLNTNGLPRGEPLLDAPARVAHPAVL